MDFEEAKSIIIYESTEGVAYTSRHGAYPDRERVDQNPLLTTNVY